MVVFTHNDPDLLKKAARTKIIYKVESIAAFALQGAFLDSLDATTDRNAKGIALPVAWAEARGWSGYLLAMSEDALAKADTLGIGKWFLADPECPASAASVERLPPPATSCPSSCALPFHPCPCPCPSPPPLRSSP